MQAWHDLGTCRAMGGAIPFTAAIAWAEFHGLDVDATLLLWQVMQQLDSYGAEREQKPDPPKSKKGR